MTAAPEKPTEQAVAETATACFHCGEPLGMARYAVVFDGVSRDTCCAGCQAVARVIIDNGLDSYYRKRTAPARAPATDSDAEERVLYDLPEFQRTFVTAPDPAGVAEATVMLDGITCAACVWLIESRLSGVTGVHGCQINYATRRARVRWSPALVRLSDILGRIAELGYQVQPYDARRSEARLQGERRTLLWRLFVAGFGMMQVMMYAVPAYMADGAMTADIEQLMRIASLILTAPVALWSAIPFYTGAWRELRNRRLGMDLPVAAGVIVAFGASLYSTFGGSGPVYFDSVSMFVFLLLAARYLEMMARARATAAQERLVRLAPAAADRFVSYPADAAVERVPAERLQAGDYVLVRPGAVIPADGVVIEGSSTADESLLTGESRPVAKSAGDRVTGGSVNRQSALTVRIVHAGQDTVLAGIVRLLDRAQSEKPRIALAADRAAQWFVGLLLVSTIAAAIGWAAIDPAQALWVAIAMLVITCPCALSLATPAALAAATGKLYGRGVLVTRGHAIETLAGATHVVFDKTGTLTTGRLSLIGTLPLGTLSSAECLELAAMLEAHSEHPVGRAIAAAATGAAAAPAVAGGVRNVPGAGMEATVNGRRVRIGRAEFVAELHGQDLPAECGFVHDDVTFVALGDERGWLALFTLGDALRPAARRLITGLKQAGLNVCLLSGDRPAHVGRVADLLGIAEWRAAATPADKLAYVRDLQAQGAVVAMVGDGVNDAPVLAQAQIAIAMGSGTELAQATADVVLMSERLEAVLDAVKGARATLRIIRQNLAWATVYNCVALPFAALGYVTPLAAAIGMSLSSLLVVLNALRLAAPVKTRDAARRAELAAVAP